MNLTMLSNSDLQRLSRSEKVELLELIEARDRARRTTLLRRYKPYAKQLEFHANGLTAHERLLLAANRVGKTFCGAAELAMHLTGQYPDWWPGRRFSGPIEAWAGSDTGETTRDTVQANLIGPPPVEDDWGTGAVPADCLGRMTRRMGVADALDTVEIKHVSGGSSLVGFKSYDQGRKKWQGTQKHVVWCDEEPPWDVYIEALTRTNTLKEGGRGMIYLTFTPLMGMSSVVHSFLDEEGNEVHGKDDQGSGRHVHGGHQ